MRSKKFRILSIKYTDISEVSDLVYDLVTKAGVT